MLKFPRLSGRFPYSISCITSHPPKFLALNKKRRAVYANAISGLRIQDNLAEHLTIFHTLMRGENILQ
jgi:hypothetical protein